MLFMPPRHGKSQIASIDFPAWYLGRNPTHEVIACSYSASLAMNFSRKVRAQLRTPEFTAVFPACQLDPEVQAAEGWQTTEGGGYLPAGVSGPITGKGAHVLVIDDPVKNREEAESANTQEVIYDWYTSTAYTRLAPGGGILVIMTRWHDMDLAGKLLNAAKEGGDQWEVVCYPAIATEDEKFRLQGEALHPERYPLTALHRIRAALGPRDWEALYQQSPVSNEGDYFKRSEMKFYQPEDLKDKRLQYYAAWDFAVGQKQSNDYSVGIVVGVDENDNVYIVDVWRGRWQSNELVEKILDLYEKWKPSIVGLEKGLIEMSIGPFLEKRIGERKLWEMYMEELKPGRRDKVARARAIQGRLQQGKVFFPADGHFTHTLIAEMLRFPSGEHDDQVDALAWVGHMLGLFHALKPPKEEQKKSWRDKLRKMAKKEAGVGNKRSAMAA
jgi:predicted phage terminase large subunit-like protein